jgi:hypothetical protein
MSLGPEGLMTISKLRSAALATGLVLAAAATAAPALAADDWSGCYVRVYDDAHLKAHRGQKVTSIRLKLEPMKNDPWVASALLTITVRGHAARLYDGGDCTAKAGGLDCGMDEDAGAVTIARSGRNMLLTVTADLRLNRKDQATEESTGPYLRAADPEDRTFLLAPGYPEGCR